MAACQVCGVDLPDAAQRFCGGDRCQRVFMRQSCAPPTVNAGATRQGGALHRTKKSYFDNFDNRRGVT